MGSLQPLSWGYYGRVPSIACVTCVNKKAYHKWMVLVKRENICAQCTTLLDWVVKSCTYSGHMALLVVFAANLDSPWTIIRISQGTNDATSHMYYWTGLESSMAFNLGWLMFMSFFDRTGQNHLMALSGTPIMALMLLPYKRSQTIKEVLERSDVYKFPCVALSAGTCLHSTSEVWSWRILDYVTVNGIVSVDYSWRPLRGLLGYSRMEFCFTMMKLP